MLAVMVAIVSKVAKGKKRNGEHIKVYLNRICLQATPANIMSLATIHKKCWSKIISKLG